MEKINNAKKIAQFLKSPAIKSMREALFYLIKCYPDLERKQYLQLLRREVDPSFESNEITARVNELINAGMVGEAGLKQAVNGITVTTLKALVGSYNEGWAAYSAKLRSERKLNPSSKMGKELLIMHKQMIMAMNAKNELACKAYSEMLQGVPSFEALKETNGAVKEILREKPYEIKKAIIAEGAEDYVFDDSEQLIKLPAKAA